MKQRRAEAAVLTERGVYAFVGWVLSIASYVVFLIWAFVPDAILVSLGITYFPSKYVAVAIPSLMFVVALLGTVFYIGLNMMRTPDPEDMLTVSTPGERRAPNHAVKCGRKEGIPDVGEIDHVTRSYFIATNGGRRRHAYEWE